MPRRLLRRRSDDAVHALSGWHVVCVKPGLWLPRPDVRRPVRGGHVRDLELLLLGQRLDWHCSVLQHLHALRLHADTDFGVLEHGRSSRRVLLQGKLCANINSSSLRLMHTVRGRLRCRSHFGSRDGVHSLPCRRAPLRFFADAGHTVLGFGNSSRVLL